MSSALLPANTAAPLDRQTPEGERVLHEALGYIARGDAAYTRRAYAGDRQHFHTWFQQTEPLGEPNPASWRPGRIMFLDQAAAAAQSVLRAGRAGAGFGHRDQEPG